MVRIIGQPVVVRRAAAAASSTSRPVSVRSLCAAAWTRSARTAPDQERASSAAVAARGRDLLETDRTLLVASDRDGDVTERGHAQVVAVDDPLRRGRKPCHIKGGPGRR